MTARDSLQRVLFEDIDARCVGVHLEQVVAQVLDKADYPPAVRSLLTQALVLAALMSSGLKFKGRISLQLQGRGPVRLLMADCTDSGGLRGIARLDEDAQIADDPAALFAGLRDGGTLTLTLDPADGGQRWQGIVPLEGGGLGEAVEAYFQRSEQLPTRIALAVSEGSGAGLMIQQMPGENEDDDAWNRLEHLLATVSAEELLAAGPEAMLTRLFHAENRRLFPARDLHFECPCSRERVLRVLESLGTAEIRDLATQEDTVEVRCQFCNTAYHFDQLDLAAIIQGGAEGSSTIH